MANSLSAIPCQCGICVYCRTLGRVSDRDMLNEAKRRWGACLIQSDEALLAELKRPERAELVLRAAQFHRQAKRVNPGRTPGIVETKPRKRKRGHKC